MKTRHRASRCITKRILAIASRVIAPPTARAWTPLAFSMHMEKISKHETIKMAEATQQQVVDRLTGKLATVFDNYDYYLVPEDSNPTFALRPVSYLIKMGGTTIEGLLINSPPNDDRVWGNPSKLSSDGNAAPFIYELDDGSQIFLTIFFQRPLKF